MNQNIIFTIARFLLAIHLIIFGLNKFFLFANVAPPEGETAQLFLGAMFTTYLAKAVGLAEISGGILLLIPKFSFVGFLILLPIVVNIIAFHLFHDLPGNGIWIFTLITMGVVAFDFKNHYSKLLVSSKKI